MARKLLFSAASLALVGGTVFWTLNREQPAPLRFLREQRATLAWRKPGGYWPHMPCNAESLVYTLRLPYEDSVRGLIQELKHEQGWSCRVLKPDVAMLSSPIAQSPAQEVVIRPGRAVFVRGNQRPAAADYFSVTDEQFRLGKIGAKIAGNVRDWTSVEIRQSTSAINALSCRLRAKLGGKAEDSLGCIYQPNGIQHCTAFGANMPRLTPAALRAKKLQAKP